MGSFKNSSLAQAWLVILLSIVFSVSLAAVHIKLSPVIEINKTKETMEKIPGLVTGEENSANTNKTSPEFTIKERTIKTDKQGISKSYIVYDAFDNSGKVEGHVIKATGQGYGDKIELLLGLDPDGKKITGLYILDQKETPGLGAKVAEDAWRDQFIGKSTDKPLVVVKGKPVSNNDIDAVSGATISSRSVTNIVNSAISDVKTKIALVPESYKNMENK